MAENLNFIPSTAPDSSWCYNDNSALCTTYGRLYDYATAKTVCPSGWHLPDSSEWEILDQSANMYTLMATTGWAVNSGTNTTGFTALPSGYNAGSATYTLLGKRGYWWTSTLDVGGTQANGRMLAYNAYSIDKSSYPITQGNSVRCLLGP